ncbi:MAG: outer membrane protein assembly factor BamD, partial [Pseudomonadota bacterium]
MSGLARPSLETGQKGRHSRPLSVLLSAVVLLAVPLVGGCGSFDGFDSLGSSGPLNSIFGKKDEVEPLNTDPAEVIYGQADQMADQGKFKEAARQYEEVDITHPYSREARRAIIMASYSYYRAGKYDEAISSADRYLTLH